MPGGIRMPYAAAQGGGRVNINQNVSTQSAAPHKSRDEMRADLAYQQEKKHKSLLEKQALKKLPITQLPQIQLQDRFQGQQDRLTNYQKPDLSYYDQARQNAEQGFETQRNRQQQEIGGALNRRLTALGQQTSGAGLGLMAKAAEDVNAQINEQKQQALSNIDLQKAQMGTQLEQQGQESGKDRLFNILQSGSQRDLQQAQFDLQRAASMGDQKARQQLVMFDQLSTLRNMDIAEKQAALDAQTTEFNKRMAERSARNQETGTVMNTIGTIAGIGAGIALSDETKKKNIKPNDEKVQSFLDNLSNKEFEYLDPKSEGAAKGKRHGVMAQDLEKSEMGKSLVKETPKGKMVDTAQGTMANMAALSQINRRLKSLESMMKKKG